MTSINDYVTYGGILCVFILDKILMAGIRERLYKKIRKLVWYTIPDNLLHRIQITIWRERHYDEDVGQVKLGGRQWYALKTSEEKSYFAYWLYNKFTMFSIFLYRHYEKSPTVKILLKLSMLWKNTLNKKNT